MRTQYTKNQIFECGDHLEMALYNKKCKEVARTKFDRDDLPEVSKYKWCLSFTGLRTKTPRVETKFKNKTLRLHQLILGKKDGLVIDHINRDPLDNRKVNLRFVTRQQNGMNRDVKGVSWYERYGAWQTSIMVNRKTIYLGRYKDLETAKKVRKEAELKYFGEFAPAINNLEE